LGRLNHIALATPDIAAGAAFYRNVLGGTVTAPEALPEHGVTVVAGALCDSCGMSAGVCVWEIEVNWVLEKGSFAEAEHVSWPQVVFVELENTKVELLEPLGAGSPIAAFLQKSPGGGMHHICYEVRPQPAQVPPDGAGVRGKAPAGPLPLFRSAQEEAVLAPSQVADVTMAIAELTRRGVRVLNPEPKVGAHGKPVVFIHPKVRRAPPHARAALAQPSASARVAEAWAEAQCRLATLEGLRRRAGGARGGIAGVHHARQSWP
jgi:methylmalonyl-CoA/ethylmalonyl-CoA epimerase